MTTNTTDKIFAYRARFEHCLQTLFENADNQSSHASAHLTRLNASMSYATLDGGKRLRAMLVYLGAQCCLNADTNLSLSQPNAQKRPKLDDWHGIDAAATAIELIHCYSLIHDDLPAMDDDTLRRGKPTCHKAFDEATAILAGDALQTLAFTVLSEYGHDLNNSQRVKLVSQLAQASGAAGMVGGQAVDLALTDQPANYDELVQMHQLKTGALISAAVVMGGICASASDANIDLLKDYGDAIGLAFQVRDDLLDLEGDPALIGKQTGMDTAANKTTFPALIGFNEARQKAILLKNKALDNLAAFGESAEPLRELAEFAVGRDR